MAVAMKNATAPEPQFLQNAKSRPIRGFSTARSTNPLTDFPKGASNSRSTRALDLRYLRSLNLSPRSQGFNKALLDSDATWKRLARRLQKGDNEISRNCELLEFTRLGTRVPGCFTVETFWLKKWNINGGRVYIFGMGLRLKSQRIYSCRTGFNNCRRVRPGLDVAHSNQISSC